MNFLISLRIADDPQYRCYIYYQKSIMQIQYEDQERQSLVDSKSSKEQKQHQTHGRQGIKPQPTHGTPAPEDMPQQIVHKVVYGDTLQGLSLQYDVPIGRIRYRNNIQGDSLYHLKEIVIPNPRCKPMDKERTEQILIEEFFGHMDYSQKSRKVARYYLEENHWNMKEAIKEYRDDLQWQRENRDKILTRPIDGPGIQMQDIKKYYEKLGHKKKMQ